MTKTPQSSEEIIATLTPSVARFWGALIIIVGFGALLLWIAASGASDSALGSIIFLICSALSFYTAIIIHKVKSQSLILTKEGLFDGAGTILCKLDDIESLDRSFFAMKPSNGFSIKLKKKADRAWVPGLWWRLGRRIGVGGVTSVAQAKSMADTMTLLLSGNPELV